MKQTTKLIFICLLICMTGRAQNNLSVARTGKNRITVYNPNNHAIAFSIPEKGSYRLYSYHGIEIDFPLNKYDVEHTPLTSFYNYDCFRLDSMECELNANAETVMAGRRMWWASFTTGLFQGTNAGRIADILAGLFSNNPDLISEILEAYKSNNTTEQKILRINKILENFYVRQHTIDQNRNNCIEYGYNQLNTNKTVRKFYAVQFIPKKENFRFEITPYYVLGFNAMQYKGQTNKRPAFSEIRSGQQLPAGGRVSLNFNAYDKYKRRKIDKKIFLVFDYSQSPPIYKKQPDAVFGKDTTYAWNFYSLGIGWETLCKNSKGKYVSSFSLDIGTVTSSGYKYNTDGAGSLATKTPGKSFKEFNIYACVSVKHKIFSRLDVFGAYKFSSALFTADANKVHREIPAFRQFQLGLNLIIAKVVNYQY